MTRVVLTTHFDHIFNVAKIERVYEIDIQGREHEKQPTHHPVAVLFFHSSRNIVALGELAHFFAYNIQKRYFSDIFLVRSQHNVLYS